MVRKHERLVIMGMEVPPEYKAMIKERATAEGCSLKEYISRALEAYHASGVAVALDCQKVYDIIASGRSWDFAGERTGYDKSILQASVRRWARSEGKVWPPGAMGLL